MNNNEDETFDALVRSPIDEVDQAMLNAFNMESPFTPVLKDIYGIELTSEEDHTLFYFILNLHKWNPKTYLERSVIEWEGIKHP